MCVCVCVCVRFLRCLGDDTRESDDEGIGKGLVRFVELSVCFYILRLLISGNLLFECDASFTSVAREGSRVLTGGRNNSYCLVFSFIVVYRVSNNINFSLETTPY